MMTVHTLLEALWLFLGGLCFGSGWVIAHKLWGKVLK